MLIAAVLLSRDQLGTLIGPNLLGLTLMPTEQCNFRCTYCYEDFEHPRMSEAVVRSIERLLERRAPDLDFLNLSWFGGEPLLAFDVIDRVQSYARSLLESRPDLEIRSSITTNGHLLDRERFARLLELGVGRYQVSLDGPRESHDRRRILAGGRGSFDRIWANLRAARESPEDFDLLIRVHVDRENRAVIPDFLRRLAASFGGDSRFRVFLREVSRLGGPGDAELPVLEGDEIDDAVAELRDLARQLGLEQYAGPPPGEACYAAAVNSLVIRSTGEIAKCTVALSHPSNRVGRLLDDGRLEIDDEKLEGWTRGIWSGDPEELRCPMNGFADPLPPVAGESLVQLTSAG